MFKAELENLENKGESYPEDDDANIVLDEYNSDDEKYKDDSDSEEEADTDEHITKVQIKFDDKFYLCHILNKMRIPVTVLSNHKDNFHHV